MLTSVIEPTRLGPLEIRMRCFDQAANAVTFFRFLSQPNRPNAERPDFFVRLLIAGGNDSRPALVTPPDQPMTASSNAANRNLHARPRLGSIDVSTLPPAPQAYGGLSPGAMRRVREYLELHLGESIDLSMLAESPGYQCIILRDNLSNPPGSRRISTSRKSESNEPRRCWFRRISR
jgi:hypothetical protein